ncbi:MAG: hypothetical protein SGJ18_03820 [Pseudomonadota bacterium]|nr:hypothetical protein [Pseudomonadota bacterium]
MGKSNSIFTVILCAFLVLSYNNCANDSGILKGSLELNSEGELVGPPIEPPPTEPPPPPPPPVLPPPNTPAYVMGVVATATGAKVTLSGPVQGLRFNYNNSGGWINLIAPFNSPYTVNLIWPEPATTFTCFQALGTDGVWRGPLTTDPLDLQRCTQVPTI